MIKFTQQSIQVVTDTTNKINNVFDRLTLILISDVSYTMLMSKTLKKADKNIHKTEIAIQKQTDDNKTLAKIFNENKLTTKQHKYIAKFSDTLLSRLNQIKSTFDMFQTLQPPEVNETSKQTILKDVKQLLGELKCQTDILIKELEQYPLPLN